MLSISGGSGIVFADRAVQRRPDPAAVLRRHARRAAQDDPGVRLAENPADVTAGVFNDMSLFTTTLDIVLADPGLDQLSILLASIGGEPAQRAAEAIAAAAAQDRQAGARRLVRPARQVRGGVEVLEAARVPF